jgi:phosphomethylpyrimidine synthase
MAKARENLDWEKQFELAIDPETARKYREERKPQKDEETCTMCGKLCSIKRVHEYLKK